MLPILLITPAASSIASLSMVLPEEAWPTIAKLRISPGLYSFIKENCANDSLDSRLAASRSQAKEFMGRKLQRKRIRDAAVTEQQERGLAAGYVCFGLIRPDSASSSSEDRPNSIAHFRK